MDRRKESSGRVAREALSWVKDAIRAAGLSCSACMIKGAQSWALVCSSERPVVWSGCHPRGGHVRSPSRALFPGWNGVALLEVLRGA